MRAAAVLHVPRSPHSSVVITYDLLAARLRERGHSLEIVTPEDLQPRGFNARLLPLLLPLAVRRWLRRRTDLDLIIFHSYAGWIAGRPRPNLRTAVAFHGFEPLFHEALAAETARRGAALSARYALMYGTLMPYMLKRACREADLVLCLNEQERDALVGQGYASGDKVRMVWHDASDAFFEPHNYRPRADRLLAVMQWLPTKGTRYLVEAFSRVARSHRELRLTIAGTLASSDVVRAEFPPDVRGRVDVHVTFDEAQHRALLADADIFVHPSLSEGFSRAVIEAMAAGVPVVTTRTGSATDRLVSGLDSLVVPVADAPALESAIESLIDDLELRQTLGRAGQDHARRLHDADSTGTLVKILEALASTPA